MRPITHLYVATHFLGNRKDLRKEVGLYAYKRVVEEIKRLFVGSHEEVSFSGKV